MPTCCASGSTGAPVSDASVRNWAGNVTFGAARVHQPESVDELRRAVATSARIRAVGSGHSFSLVADTTHDLVRLDRLPGIVEIDVDSSMATVSAGMTYADVATRLHRAGYALANLASVPHISVAGACATATHGSGDTLRCLAASVAAVELVGPEGDVVELSRVSEPGTFVGSVVAFGALGIITRVMLDIEPTFDVCQRVRVEVALDDVVNRLDDLFSAAYSVSVFTDWASDVAAVWLKTRHGPVGQASEEEAERRVGGRSARAQLHPVPGLPPDRCTPQLGVWGPWHERLPHFRAGAVPSTHQELQSEYFLPRDAAAQAFASLREVGHLVAPVVHIAEVRTVRADDLWLSPAHGRDSITIHFTWIADAAAVMPVLAAVERRLMPLGARPHWGKLTAADPTEIISRYEYADHFGQLLRAFDPGGKFRNDFVDRLLLDR
jgi:alditol oxidase